MDGMKKETRMVELTYEEMREICIALDMHGDYWYDTKKERAEQIYELSNRFMAIRREMLEHETE